MIVVMLEVLKQKLGQLWGLIMKWSIADYMRWALRQIQYFWKLLEANLPAVKSTRQFIAKRISHVPSPSSLWSSSLKEQLPLPTSAPWLNFVLNEGSLPEYIHPYLISCKQGALWICYHAPVADSKAITQPFTPDIVIGSSSFDGDPLAQQHMVTAFDDLSVTLLLRGNVQVPLVRGCPYVTFTFNTLTIPEISLRYKATELECTRTRTKHKLYLENGQTWIIYSSHELLLELVKPGTIKATAEYKGHLRVALLNGGGDAETVLDEHSATHPTGGKADLSVPFQVKYTWEKAGRKQGTLLMLRLPVHRDMVNDDQKEHGHDSSYMRPSVAYDGIDGKMEAVARDSWVIKTHDMAAVGWHSVGGIRQAKSKTELKEVLRRDMSELKPLPASIVSAYSHGKLLARVARMALIAEELGSCRDVLNQAREFLNGSLTPWIEGAFGCNTFLYDSKWGGIVVDEKRRWYFPSSSSKGAYDDAHYTLGYFCYAGAVLAKLDGAWGEAHKSQLYTLVRDYMSTKSGFRKKSKLDLSEPYVFPKLRYFDLWVLHSWSGSGLVESEHGRRQRSSSEALHAYYAGAMLGAAFHDKNLVDLGLTLASFEIKSAQLLWHIPSSSTVYPQAFTSHNRMVGVLWASKRESLGPISDTAQTSPADDDNARIRGPLLGSGDSFEQQILPHHLVSMQVAPLLPISQFLFTETGFAKELVDWASRFLSNPLTIDAWKGCVYALEALYCEPNYDVAKKAYKLSYPPYDGPTSLSILLWWIFLHPLNQPLT